MDEASASSDDEGCVPGTENCICEDDSDCGPGLVCASRQCTPEVDGSSSSTTEPGATTTTGTPSEPGTSSESSGDSTGPGETEGAECDPELGVLNGACDEDPSRPYCDASGTCVGCSALSDCVDVSPLSPVCDDSGRCVPCNADDIGACGGTAPVCDQMNMCAACTAHEECEIGACNFATGACFDAALYVDRSADCASGTGAPETPFCEIMDAVSQAVAGESLVVRVKPSGGAYTDQIQVAANRTVAIVRDGSGTVNLQVPNLDAVVANDNASAFLYNLRISGGMINIGVRCLNASVWLDRVQIEKREGHAIDGIGCTLTVRRSKIYDNNAGGLKLDKGDARVENTYIVQNGNSFADNSAIGLSGGANLDIVYTTIADNDAKNGVGESIHCAGAGDVSVRNAIVFGKAEATSVVCPDVTATDSVVDATALTGTGVIHEPQLDPAWFVAPATGNFAIKAGAPFADAATWLAGDPRVDYDGDPRITNDGTPDYTGADRPN
jgi:hypothetical protein